MSEPKKISRKLYYSIGEVAKIYNVNTSLIRFWEKEFDIIKPKKNKKGNRLFTPKDLDNFNKIYELVKIEGFTLDGAKKALKNKMPISSEPVAGDRNEEVVLMLKDMKLKIAQLLDEIDH